MKRKPQTGLILVLEPGLPATRRNQLRRRLEDLGVEVRYVSGGAVGYLEVEGPDLPIRSLYPEQWEGVVRCVHLTPDFPFASWKGPQGDPLSPTVVNVGPRVSIGAGNFPIAAGPCSIEGRQQALDLARKLESLGARIFRGGAFKPRTSPYAFQGLEDEGLEILREVREETGLAVVTEVMEGLDLDKVSEVADMLQVGSRNMHNYALLRRLGQQRKPVLLKRGFSATLDELLLSAEYILSGGNDQVVLCERGLRHGSAVADVVLDLGVVPELKRRTHLPVIVDPSHGGARSHRVLPLARAAAAVGADGLLVEVHCDPERALSDGRQAITPEDFRRLRTEVEAIRRALEEHSTPRPGTVPVRKE